MRRYEGPLDRLQVDLDRRPSGFSLWYDGGSGPAELAVEYPFAIDDLPDSLMGALGLAGAVYLGGLALAGTVELSFPVPPAAIRAIAPVAEMIWDVRRWKDGLRLTAPPEIIAPAAELQPVDRSLDPRRSTLLWSGGKDSTLGAVLLQENGYRVSGAHVSANTGVEEAESRAVTGLAADLEVALSAVRYSHEDFLEFSGRHAKLDAWDDFPLCNRIPFGRDLLLAALAVPVALHDSAAHLSMGHDAECRAAYFEYDGKSVPRNDVESGRGAAALGEFLGLVATPALRLLPPVSGLSELRILHDMIVGHPELMARASFCFWGGNCGRCAKCLRYHLAQRLFGVDVLQFQVDPLSEGACPELDDVFRVGATGVLFQEQILYCMGRLVQRGDIRPGETRLTQYAATVHPLVEERLDAWRANFLRVHPDPAVPVDFRYGDSPVMM